MDGDAEPTLTSVWSSDVACPKSFPSAHIAEAGQARDEAPESDCMTGEQKPSHVLEQEGWSHVAGSEKT